MYRKIKGKLTQVRNPRGRNFWFTNNEDYKDFTIESRYSAVGEREHCSVLKKKDGGVQFLRYYKDSWINHSFDRIKEMNEIEAICIRVAEKWR